MAFEMDKARSLAISQLTGRCEHKFDKVGYCQLCGMFYAELPVEERDPTSISSAEKVLALVAKLASAGLWDEFYKLTETVYINQVSKDPLKDSYHVAWLLSDHKRFIWIVSEFLGKQPNAEPRT